MRAPSTPSGGDSKSAPASPCAMPYGRVFVVCFAIAAGAFVAVMVLVLMWFRTPTGPEMSFAPGSSPSGGGGSSRRPRGPTTSGRADQPAGLTEQQIRLFFTADGATLRPVVISFPRSLDAAERLRLAVERLLQGPDTEFLRSPLPLGVVLRGAYQVDDTAVVDLSGAIRSEPLGGVQSELLCVYALVNTAIENAPSAAAVRILVDGREAPTLWGQVDLSEPLTADASLVRY